MTEPAIDAVQITLPPSRWKQISLYLEPPAPASETAALLPDAASHTVQEALETVHQAQDVLTQREVLARVYQHLAEQAVARGQRPVPKRTG